jgi:hypothetical protein
MLGEFFAAKEDEIDEVLDEGPFGRARPTVEAKTVSSVSIATLGEILGAGSYDDLFERVDGASGESGIEPESRPLSAAPSAGRITLTHARRVTTGEPGVHP